MDFPVGFLLLFFSVCFVAWLNNEMDKFHIKTNHYFRSQIITMINTRHIQHKRHIQQTPTVIIQRKHQRRQFIIYHPHDIHSNQVCIQSVIQCLWEYTRPSIAPWIIKTRPKSIICYVISILFSSRIFKRVHRTQRILWTEVHLTALQWYQIFELSQTKTSKTSQNEQTNQINLSNMTNTKTSYTKINTYNN